MSEVIEGQGDLAPKADDGKGKKADELPPEALKERLARERGAGAKEAEAALAAKLGMTPEAAAKALEEYQKLQDSTKTEQQRLQEERDALKPKASRADVLEKRLAELSDVEYSLLSDEQKLIADDLSKREDGTVDHDARIKVIASLKRRGVISAQAGGVIKDGADTSKAKPAPKTETEPEKDSPDYHHAKWSKLPDGVLKTAYFNDHAGAIRQAKAYGNAN
jgi:hypothetical protein